MLSYSNLADDQARLFMASRERGGERERDHDPLILLVVVRRSLGFLGGLWFRIPGFRFRVFSLLPYRTRPII